MFFLFYHNVKYATLKPHFAFPSPEETHYAICPIVVSKAYKGTYGRLRYYDLFTVEFELWKI